MGPYLEGVGHIHHEPVLVQPLVGEQGVLNGDGARQRRPRTGHAGRQHKGPACPCSRRMRVQQGRRCCGLGARGLHARSHQLLLHLLLQELLLLRLLHLLLLGLLLLLLRSRVCVGRRQDEEIGRRRLGLALAGALGLLGDGGERACAKYNKGSIQHVPLCHGMLHRTSQASPNSGAAFV